MSYYNYNENWTEDEIFVRASELEGKRLGDIDIKGWLKKRANKGNIGNMIQEDFFGIPANSKHEADFLYHEIELKVTPVLKSKTKGFSSKERLVLSMINYMKDYNDTFTNSVVYQKTKHMLIIFYLHEENVNPEDFIILKTIRFQLPKKDYEIVECDYNQIMDMINSGSAHELSERQQQVLAACTKGQGKGRDFVQQPYSDIVAKSRAYSYKVGYMSSYIRTILNPDKVEHLDVGKSKSTLDYVQSVLNKYKGKTLDEIEAELKVEVNGKSKLFNIICNIFKTNGKNINQTQEFLEAGINIKTVTDRLVYGKNQDMSFPNLDFTELYNDDFEESTWYGFFAETKYILVLWKEYEKDCFILEDYILWVPSDEIIASSKELYEKIQTYLFNGNIIVQKDGEGGLHDKWSDNFPGKKKDSKFFQIRPKGSGDSVLIQLKNGMELKRKCLFINKEFIRYLFKLDNKYQMED